jgi:leader peptidase (prepilin peptidase)/N-methyltransferase
LLYQVFEAIPAFYYGFVGVVGLLVGSFLNVVIHRLPIMLERSWQRECRSFLGLEVSEEPGQPYNLIVPGSRCPGCGKPVLPHENIPVLSYLWLRGRCSGCGMGISPRYPAVELLTALVSLTVAWHFGLTWQAAAALLLSWSLIGLSFIDLDRQLLPDAITLPLLWAGLLLSLFDIFAGSASSILGAVFGYLSLWSVYQLFRLATGKEGMGHGDFKLLALLGAWLGWEQLPAIVLLSSLVGALVGVVMIVAMRHDRQVPIPFGPYLALAGWIALLWGDAINGAYLRLAGMAG